MNELELTEPPVEGALLQKLVVTAVLHNAPFLDEHDPVGEPDRREPVRN
ncbi:MAG: hypothetical protein HYY59_01855 [Candidatus Omnitrophica bacterium]|nr:hypothetical protein [Candidatus Omnitrophota bacterium]